MTIVSMEDMRTSLAAIANRAAQGERFIVVRKSKPVFEIVPVATESSPLDAPPPARDWLQDFFALADRVQWHSEGKRVRREELYDA